MRSQERWSNLVAENSAAAISFTRNLSVLVALLILALPATSRAKTAPRPLSSYNWSVNASPNLATKPPPKAAVRRLMEQLEPDYGEANDETRICSFRFVDLGHDGNLTLLVSRYDGGRGGCGDVYVVDRTAGGFQQHDLSTTVYGNDNVSDVLGDIDGKTYLTLPNYRVGNECSAGYTRIYAWDGSNYSNQSDQPRFKPYYEQEIEMLKKRVPDDNPECNNRSIAMIQRDLLGAPPNTGLDDAIKLAKSSDPLRRVFAAKLLADIGTAETKPYLHALISDPNQEVADAARRAYA
ncbi:HEAT repeat domain-containing protein, partial [Candidatus Binatus sp.]